MTSPLQFRRLILGLASGRIDRGLLEPSAELANLLGASIQAVFVEDEAWTQLPAFSGIREFDPLSHQWRPLEATRIAEDVQLMVRSARRRLDKVALRWRVKSFLEVVRSGSLEEFLRVANPADILVLSASESAQAGRSPLAPETGVPVEDRLTALFLPRRVIRHEGPVVAMASPTGDAALRVAATIAQRTAERLILLVPPSGQAEASIAEAAGTAGLAQNRIEVLGLARSETQNFLAAVERVAERITILPRAADEGVDPSTIASRRLTPVMLVDPRARFE